MNGHDLKGDRDNQVPDDVGHLMAHIKGHHLPYQEIVQHQKTHSAASRWTLLQETLDDDGPERLSAAEK